MSRLITLTELIGMATVSKEFRQELLTNPSQALHHGYQGENFELTPKDEIFLLKHSANTLSELAEHILTQINSIPPPTNQQKIIITPHNYPVFTTHISEQLKQSYFNVESAKDCLLINSPPKKTDLVLYCPITNFSDVVCTKLMALYPQKLVVLTDFKHHKIPNYLLERAHFISLNEPISQIVTSIQQACSRHGTFYSQKAAMQLIKQYTTNEHTKNDELTSRENQVVCLLNLSNPKIAEVLSISVSTVRTHIKNINQKMGFDVRNRLQLGQKSKYTTI